jgi:hypothetical protein
VTAEWHAIVKIRSWDHDREDADRQIRERAKTRSRPTAGHLRQA